jgi:XTP/dITP diphosphohydrolase
MTARLADLRRVVVATGNPGKIREIEQILGEMDIATVPMSDLGDPPDVVEDGLTFEANARKKATKIAAWSGLPSLADDSGLEVDALGGAPGVWSARFAGDQATDAENLSLLLERLKTVAPDKRTARFQCVIVLALPDGGELVARGDCEGRIANEREGVGGFGYDPVFVESQAGQTFGVLPPDYKNRVSHRAKALASFAAQLPEI